MAKKVIKTITYIAVSVFLFIVLNLLMTPKYVEVNQDGRITAEFYREKLANDVIFVGSSTVHAGISPVVLWEKYGITSYDRSNASQTMPISYFMVKDAISVNKPRLVVLDVGFLLQGEDYFEEPSVRKALDGMRASSVKLECIKACEPVVDYKKMLEYIFPVFRFHARWNDLSLEDLKYLFYKPDVTFNGQLVDLEGRQFSEDEFADVSEAGQFICDSNMAYLQTLADLCSANGISFMLIKLPRIYQTFTGEANDQIIDFAAKNNIIYKDFQDLVSEINASGNCYRDQQHMNTYGAEKFSIILGEYIVSRYDIPSHSGEGDFVKVWSEKSRRYREALSQQ